MRAHARLLAARLARRWFSAPPTLGAFRGLKKGKAAVLVGVLVAWSLGAVLEELVFRGVMLTSVRAGLSGWVGAGPATVVAILVAAIGAGLLHLYQGERAALIVTQLSVLFGVLFVVAGDDLWAVMLCHGFYDTIAFVRFANGTSRFASFDQDMSRGPT